MTHQPKDPKKKHPYEVGCRANHSFEHGYYFPGGLYDPPEGESNRNSVDLIIDLDDLFTVSDFNSIEVDREPEYDPKTGKLTLGITVYDDNFEPDDPF